LLALAHAPERRTAHLLAAARVGDRPGDHDRLAGQRRIGGDLRREVLVADVEVDAELAQARDLRAGAVAVEVRPQAGCPTFGPMSSTH
jgi:hypothetical protein